MTRRYGIFFGSFGEDDATWLESVEGLEAACKRMEKIATDLPGRYFVFSPDSKEPLASIDTTKTS